MLESLRDNMASFHAACRSGRTREKSTWDMSKHTIINLRSGTLSSENCSDMVCLSSIDRSLVNQRYFVAVSTASRLDS
jgi:hypothetical protein